MNLLRWAINYYLSSRKTNKVATNASANAPSNTRVRIQARRFYEHELKRFNENLERYLYFISRGYLPKEMKEIIGFASIYDLGRYNYRSDSFITQEVKDKVLEAQAVGVKVRVRRIYFEDYHFKQELSRVRLLRSTCLTTEESTGD